MSFKCADISAYDLFTGQLSTRDQLGWLKIITSLSGKISLSETGEMMVHLWELTFFYVKAGFVLLLKSNVKPINQLK